MPEKLCPIDKEPCIGERCAIFNEDLQKCSWAIVDGEKARMDREKERQAGREAVKKSQKERSSQYRVHLFD